MADQLCPFCSSVVQADSNRISVAGNLYHKTCWKEQLRAGARVLPFLKVTSASKDPATPQARPPSGPLFEPPSEGAEKPGHHVRHPSRHHHHHRHESGETSGDEDRSPSPTAPESEAHPSSDPSSPPPHPPPVRATRSLSTLPPKRPLSVTMTASEVTEALSVEANRGRAPSPLPRGSPPPPIRERSDSAAPRPSTAGSSERRIFRIFSRSKGDKGDPEVEGAASAAAAPPASAAPADQKTFEEKVQKGLKKASLNPEDLQLGQKIGEGATGAVYRAKYVKRKGKKVGKELDTAVKMLHSPEFLTPEQKDEFVREVTLLKSLRNPHIVKFVGVVVSDSKLWLVTEFIPGGMLKDILYSRPIEWAIRSRVALDIARGLQCLHANNIIHRDLKSENLLVVLLSLDAPTTVKLIDFGASRAIKDDAQRFYTKGIGTPIYMSPEALTGGKYSTSTDVFSFGVLVWELVAQKQPYAEFVSPWKVSQFVISGSRLAMPPNTPSDIALLVTSCWAQDPESRPSSKEVVSQLQAHMKSASKY